MENLKRQFGKRIKELREKKNFSQEQLAEIVNMESRHISRIETGKSFTTLENIYKIANALGVNISTIFDFEHKKSKKIIQSEIIDFIKHSNEKELELILRIIKSVCV